MKLRISPDLSLPESTATSTILVLGGKGMGKTNLDAVIAEECSACRIRFSWLDPIGVAWSLQHGATKAAPGLEVLVLGGIHGDIPIEPLAGAIVADMVVDHDVSVVIDISRFPTGKMWSHGAQIRFVTDYMVRLYERQGEKRRPLLQIFDEIGRFAPQNLRSGQEDIAACLGAIEQIVELGRNVGIGMLMSTQRNAKIAAGIRELADAMFAFRTVGPLSLKAVKDWLGEHVEAKDGSAILEQIRKLPVGQAMLVSPGWLQLERVVPVRKRTTFDASATPTGGSGRAPGKARKPDLAKYRALMAATIEKAVADDPARLRKELADAMRRVKELEAAGAKDRAAAATAIAKAEAATKTETKRVDVPVLKKGELAALERAVEKFDSLTSRFSLVSHDLGEALRPVYHAIQQVLSASTAAIPAGDPTTSATAFLGVRGRAAGGAAVRAGGSGRDAAPGERPVSNREVTAQAPSSSTAIGQRTPPARTPSASRSDITGPQQALLDALAFLESVGIAPASRVQVALVAGVSPTSSGFEKNAGKVRSLGLVHYPREAAMELTDEGRASAKAPASVSVADLHQTLYGLLSGPQADLLRALVHAYPGILTREELAAIAGVSVTSSGFEKNVGMLRTRGLAIYPEKGYVEAAPAIFLEAGVE